MGKDGGGGIGGVDDMQERRTVYVQVPVEPTQDVKQLQKTLEIILKVAKDNETGERQHLMTDWDYVAKRCEEALGINTYTIKECKCRP